MTPPDCELHHIGYLVPDIGQALTGVLGLLSKPAGSPVRIPSQKVSVLLAPFSNGVFLELVQPDPDNDFLNRLLRRGVGFYHTGFLCRDLGGAAAALAAAGARELPRFSSEAFEGRQCVFFVMPDGGMIELIDRG